MTLDRGGGTGSIKADRDVTFLRLLAEAHEPDGDAVALAVEQALGRDWSGQPWQVRPLFGSARSGTGSAGAPALARFFEVTGAVETRRLEQVGWELGYGLADTGAFDSVRPDLPTGSYQIDEAEGVFGDEPHLPETDRPNYTWALDNIAVPQAWRLTPPEGGRTHGEGVLVGHIDTGYTRHPQVGLEALDRERDWDFVSHPEDDDALDPLQRSSVPLASFPGHGTSTGSVIAGRGEGLLTGVAPRATLLPIRTIRSVVEVKEGDVGKAIHYAVANGAHVISMSLGGLPFAGVEAAVDYAVDAGVIVMAAAGNFVPFRPVVWPARYRNCIAVAATDARDAPWRYSSHGEAIAISAPGASVWVASWDLSGRQPVAAGLNRSRGTSHAVAHLAGVAALWLAYHGRAELLDAYGPRLSAAFRHLVATTSRRPSRWDDSDWGRGIVDAAALLPAGLPHPDSLEGPGDESAASDGAAPSLADVFPPGVATRVSQRLGTLLGAEGAEGAAPRTPVTIAESLGRYNDELLYLMLEKPEVRSALTQEPDRETPGHQPDATLRAVLRRTASPSLLHQAGLAP